MIELSELPEAEDADPQPAPAAVAIALGAAQENSDLAVDAKEFLRKQSRLLELQMENLHEQRQLHLSHLKWRRFSDWMKAALQIVATAVGILAVVALVTMAWSAHEDRGLVIEAFSAPPDLAARGLTGRVLATQMLDKISALQAATTSDRAPQTYENNWGDDIKVEIPETGVSIGDLNRALRAWLGGETHITGEVVRGGTGLAVSARAGAESAQTFRGSEADLDQLMQRAAEAVYAQTQPYRYAVYLASQGRTDEAVAAYAMIATSGSEPDRPWAYAGWSIALVRQGKVPEAIEKGKAAVQLNPRLVQGYVSLTGAEIVFEYEEAFLADNKRMLRVIREGALAVRPGTTSTSADAAASSIDFFLGDMRSAATRFGNASFTLEGSDSIGTPRFLQGTALAFGHDVAGAQSVLAQAPETPASVLAGDRNTIRLALAYVLEDWTALAAVIEDEERQLAITEPALEEAARRSFTPYRAYALARLGQQADAETVIDTTPTDCVICLRMRANIAAAKQDWPSAERWFAETVRQAPSIPTGYSDWAETLIAKGDLDGAIAKLKLANEKGPHFADPLELWGEVLMRRKDYNRALVKFQQAAQYAPEWGRLHLRWGQTLQALGKPKDAQREFALATHLALSADDQAELAALAH